MNFSETSLLSLLKTIYRQRKLLLRTTAAGLVLSAMASLLLPNYYKAYSKFIPTNPAQNMPQIIFSNGTGANTPYGSSDDLDRLQNIAQSGEVLAYLTQKFHLYAHYKMDSTDRLAPYYLGLQFNKLYSVTKDEFGGIEVAIEDTDPKFAADITNAAVAKIAEIDRTVATANLRSITDAYEQSLIGNSKAIDSFSTKINRINRNYKYSSIALRRELLVQASPGMTADAQLGMLQKAGHLSADSLAAITENLYNAGLLDSRRAEANNRYIVEYGLYMRAKSVLESGIKTMQVIEAAAVPLVKSRPKRGILVLGATFLTLFLSVIGILLFEQYRAINWKQIFDEN